jgi:hypothetical protein
MFYLCPMGFAHEQLRDKALEALHEAAEQSAARPIIRTKALRFALAYLWATSGAERGMFDWFWKSLADDNAIGRSQNVSAALNGIYRALGLSRP